MKAKALHPLAERFVMLAVAWLLVPLAAHAQERPWTVSLVPTVNPLAIGGAHHVLRALRVPDARAREIADTPLPDLVVSK